MSITGIIYRATNIENGKAYIGQTYRDLEIRKREHFRDAFNVNHKCYNTHFYSAIRKYDGRDVWIWDIIYDNIPINELGMYERFYVALYSTFGELGYNSDSGGNNGFVMSEDTKTRMSIAHKGKPSNAKGKRFSDAGRANMSTALKGIPKSEEWKKTMRGENHPRAKLTAKQVLEIVNSNKSQKELSKMYGVNKKTIYDIMIGKNWSSVTYIGEKNE